MGARFGQDYLNRLKSQSREVWLDGQRIDSVAEHPAFRAPAEQLAKLYDLQHDSALRDRCLYESPSSGELVPTAFMVPRSQADLVKRHEAFQVFAEGTMGMMGRSQDFLNTTLMALADGAEVFGRGGQRYADNIVAYYEYVRENDLFLTHALIQPQIDRSKSSAEQAEQFLHLGVVEEQADGVIVRGARMLATLAPVADEVLIYNLPGMRPGDDQHALAFALPIDAPGLRLICRQPYDNGDSNSFDHPLAANFEESDALVVFDDVLVPWDRLFVYKDVELANAMYGDTNLRQHTAHQTNVRGLIKVQLATGVAMSLAKSIKADQHLHVQQMLGEAVGYIELIKASILRAEVEHEITGNGSVRARFEPLQTLRGFLPTVYPRVIEILQTIGAGGLMIVPGAADFQGGVAADVQRYFQGAEGLPAVERARIFKVASDLAMSAFGSRQVQYERYYAGDPVRLLAGNYKSYDKSQCDALVARATEMAGDPVPAATPA